MSDTLKSLRFTLLAIVAALFVSAFIIVITDIEALGDGNFGKAFSTLGSAYWGLFKGSFGSLRAISNTITGATPLLLAGLAVSSAFKAGLFNIGATGQMLAGAMTGLWVGFAFQLPAVLHVPLALLAAGVGGGEKQRLDQVEVFFFHHAVHQHGADHAPPAHESYQFRHDIALCEKLRNPLRSARLVVPGEGVTNRSWISPW